MGNDAQNRASAQADLRQRIVDARGALHEAEVDAALAGDALATAEAELEQRRKQLAWRTHVTDVVRKQLLNKARALDLGKTLDTIVDIETAIADLHTAGNRLRMAGTALLERPITNVGAPLAIVLTLVATAWLAMDWLHFDRLVAEYLRWIGAALGVLGALVAPIQLAARKVRAFASELERARDEYDHATIEAGGMNASDRAAIERARREFSSAEASVVAARDRLARLLEARATADPRRRLGAFLEERVQSMQYRSQQGIISLVHKDFRELAALMREHSAEDPATAAPIRPFDRIVLYVDDLDRCQPAQVVAMLEAVQLLLALDLFVVVVAVDSRWLTRSLEVHYAAFFGDSDSDSDSDSDLRRSTPQNYLEKIFQITYALRAMDPKHFGGYVEALANPGGDRTPTPAVALPTDEQVDASTPGWKPDTQPRSDDESNPATPDPADVSSATTTTIANTTTTTASTTPGQPTRPLVRARVRIDASERKYIEALVALLPTPRIVKRLVKVYRLIKSSKDAEAQAAARANSADRATLLMLAVLFGRPGVAAELLRELQEGSSDFQNAPQTLCDALGARLQKIAAQPADTENSENRAAWLEVAALLRTIDPTMTVGTCANVVPDVARYSLVTGHESHTWQARKA